MSTRVINGIVYDGMAIPYIPHGKEEPGTLFIQTIDGARFIFKLDKFFPATQGLLKALLQIVDDCEEKEIKIESLIDYINQQIILTKGGVKTEQKYKMNLKYISDYFTKKKRKKK